MDETNQDSSENNGSKDREEERGQTEHATPDQPKLPATAHAHESPSLPPVSDVQEGKQGVQHESKNEQDPHATTAALEEPTSTSTTTCAKTAKGSFLHKMGVRKTSFTEVVVPMQSPSSCQGGDNNSDASSVKSHTTHLSTTSSKLTKKRSSKKLLGKLVPKFLQTSFSPTLSSASPITASHAVLEGDGVHSSSPMSTRSRRSGSTSSYSIVEGPTDIVQSSSSVSYSTKGSQESLALPEVGEDEEGEEVEEEEEEVEEEVIEMVAAPVVGSQTSPEFLRSLRSDSTKMAARRLSSASATSDKNEKGTKEENNTMPAWPATIYKVEVEYAEEAVEESEDEEEEKKVREPRRIETLTKKIDDDPPLSPYIIDENCDDDFFLNSVLRKKSLSNFQQTEGNRPQQYQHQQQSHQRYSSSPSMSGWSSNNSSQPSTPSPTSPLTLNGQVYPFPTMMKINQNHHHNIMNVSAGTGSMHQTMHMHYRTNPLPAPAHTGHDEKRSRLRDAVGEWRRATNASN